MNALHFDSPQWVHATWFVIGLVALLAWFELRRSSLLDRFVSSNMQQRLLYRWPAVRRWMAIGLLGAAAMSIVVALMRPQFGSSSHATPRVGAQIMVCLDVSKSMLAEDTAPNRLERAKAELVDLLAYLDGDQVGLIGFAGRAAVLCPMTSDFGFLRLVLESVGPSSIGRGGTRLEAPIRKAIEGFRSQADVSRAIILITDGEDHDSYPVEAARAAAERGIKIVAIGFGDEAGSELFVTDPQTGARTQVRDNAGRPVRTRLDGETLREMALATEGAYVPAGTGALDLESIYDAHVSPLMRGRMDGRERVVRNDVFQWFVLVALLLFVASVGLSSGPARPAALLQQRADQLSRIAAAVVLLVVLGTPAVPIAVADGVPDDGSRPPAGESGAAEPSLPPAAAPIPDDPRAAYNAALTMLVQDADRAEQLLTAARRDSRTDAELRFRATFNMAWVEIERANGLIEAEPEQALEHLHAAANWFRDAIRLRPEDDAARHNLEVVLQRILELADSLAPQDERELEKRLDDLIAAQRQQARDVQELVDQQQASDESAGADPLRGRFRALAVEQRKLMSDAQSMIDDVGSQLDTLQAQPQDKQTSEDRVRAAQLTGVQHYAYRAVQRMGQARSQLRRRAALRGYRRAATGLTELKRARDQLRGPAELLGVLIADAHAVANHTEALSSANDAPDNDAPARDASLSIPAWLNVEHLREDQLSVTERTGELAERLAAGVVDEEPPQVGPSPPGQPLLEAPEPGAERSLAKLRAATPFVQEGVQQFGRADQSLAQPQLTAARQQQVAGIVALVQARERFLDVRGLIELMHAVQLRVQSLVRPPEEYPLDQRVGLVPPALEAQRANLERADRLEDELRFELLQLAGDQPAGPPLPNQPPAADDQQQQRAQYEQALDLLDQARLAMQSAQETLNQVMGAGAEETPTADELIAAAGESVDLAVEHLMDLRRLFFSIVEHLRETAHRQSELNDDTQQALTLAEDEQLAQELAPLADRQERLSEITQQLAEALRQQSQQPAASPPGQPPAGGPSDQELAELTQRFAEASELVRAAHDQMEAGQTAMTMQPPTAEPVTTAQAAALEQLIQAIALLQPPQDQQQDQPQDQQQQQNQPGQGDQDQQEPQDQQQSPDPSRILQAVRDLEAHRRRNRPPRTRGAVEPVEKDW